jgi:hypothetical protein
MGMEMTIFVAPVDGDLILVSADGVRFRAHRKNLSVHSTIFSDADTISESTQIPEEVPLTETSDVLEPLLKFMYQQPQPDLDNAPFGTLADLTKAVEKYGIFAAMHKCKMMLR